MAKKANNEPTCSFCGRPAGMGGAFLIPSPFDPSTMICSECVEQVHEIIAEQEKLKADKNKKKVPDNQQSQTDCRHDFRSATPFHFCFTSIDNIKNILTI